MVRDDGNDMRSKGQTVMVRRQLALGNCPGLTAVLCRVRCWDLGASSTPAQRETPTPSDLS